MTEVLWDAVPPSDPKDASARLPAAARKVVEAVRAGSAGRLFPPVLRPGEDGTLAHHRFPAGDTDAAVLAAALATPRFAPLTVLLDSLGAWCRATAARHGGLLAPGLPEALTAAVRALGAYGEPDRMRRRVTVLSLRRWTAGGFEPVPAAAPPRPLADGDLLRGDPRSRVLWAPDGDGGTLCAANGHDTRTPLGHPDVLRLVRVLSGASPVPVAVADLLSAVGPGARRADVRDLLVRLESFGALRRGT